MQEVVRAAYAVAYARDSNMSIWVPVEDRQFWVPVEDAREKLTGWCSDFRIVEGVKRPAASEDWVFFTRIPLDKAKKWMRQFEEKGCLPK